MMNDNSNSASGEACADNTDDVIEMPPRKETLPEWFERLRRHNEFFRAGPFIKSSFIDAIPLDELPDVTDEILLAHAARMVIRAVAKVEYAWVQCDGGRRDAAFIPQDDKLLILILECNRMTAFYQKMKERMAKIDHLASICERGKKLTFPKPRLPRAKLKKESAG